MARTEEQIAESKERRREYMRNYKREQYKRDKTLTEKAKMYYTAKKCTDVTLDEVKKFPCMKSDFAKILNHCRKIQKSHPEDLKTFLLQVLEDIDES